MIHPSYIELMQSVNRDSDPEEPIVKSRYSIVTATARRARQLIDQTGTAEEFAERKPLSVAVDEIYKGSVRILSDEQALEMQEEEEERKLLGLLSPELSEEEEAADEMSDEAVDETADEMSDEAIDETADETSLEQEGLTALQAADEIEDAAGMLEEDAAAEEEAQKNALPPVRDQIEIDDFEKMDIRVCLVKDCEIVKRANRLLKLTLDDGLGERVIVSSIRQDYKPEELVGRKILVLVNLKPAKLSGITSNGMLLAASGD